MAWRSRRTTRLKPIFLAGAQGTGLAQRILGNGERPHLNVKGIISVRSCSSRWNTCRSVNGNGLPGASWLAGAEQPGGRRNRGGWARTGAPDAASEYKAGDGRGARRGRIFSCGLGQGVVDLFAPGRRRAADEFTLPGRESRPKRVRLPPNGSYGLEPATRFRQARVSSNSVPGEDDDLKLHVEHFATARERTTQEPFGRRQSSSARTPPRRAGSDARGNDPRKNGRSGGARMTVQRSPSAVRDSDRRGGSMTHAGEGRPFVSQNTHPTNMTNFQDLSSSPAQTRASATRSPVNSRSDRRARVFLGARDAGRGQAAADKLQAEFARRFGSSFSALDVSDAAEHRKPPPKSSASQLEDARRVSSTTPASWTTSPARLRSILDHGSRPDPPHARNQHLRPRST